MPYELTFVMPEVALCYKGVTVYRVYPADMRGYEPMRTVFTLQPKSHNRNFTVTDIKDPIKGLKEIIDDGIENRAIFDQSTPEYALYWMYLVLSGRHSAESDYLAKSFLSMHQTFYYGYENKVRDLAEEVSNDHYLRAEVLKLAELFKQRTQDITTIVRWLSKTRITHILLQAYWKSGRDATDVANYHSLTGNAPEVDQNFIEEIEKVALLHYDHCHKEEQ